MQPGRTHGHGAAPIVCEPGAPSGSSPAQYAAVTPEFQEWCSRVRWTVICAAILRKTGKVIWDFDTAREFRSVNGVKATGGSIDGPGAVVVNGMVFVSSGYSRFGGMPGNVLLAFAGDEK